MDISSMPQARRFRHAKTNFHSWLILVCADAGFTKMPSQTPACVVMGLSRLVSLEHHTVECTSVLLGSINSHVHSLLSCTRNYLGWTHAWLTCSETLGMLRSPQCIVGCASHELELCLQPHPSDNEDLWHAGTSHNHPGPNPSLKRCSKNSRLQCCRGPLSPTQAYKDGKSVFTLEMAFSASSHWTLMQQTYHDPPLKQQQKTFRKIIKFFYIAQSTNKRVTKILRHYVVL